MKKTGKKMVKIIEEYDNLLFHITGFDSVGCMLVFVLGLVMSFKFFLFFFKGKVPEVHEIDMLVKLLYFLCAAVFGFFGLKWAFSLHVDYLSVRRDFLRKNYKKYYCRR